MKLCPTNADRWLRPLAAGVMVLISLAGGSSAGENALATEKTLAAENTPAGKVKLTNHILNKYVRLLDGQWQGTHVASNGKVYVGGASHNPKLGAAFFQYDPETGAMKMLVENITYTVGEDPAKTPPQGKIHSQVVEHEGWLYFGTHLADYGPKGMAAYTGAHLVGYELATGEFRDFGVIRKNYTNYAAIGLDAKRAKIYVYLTPFSEGDGSHLYRVDIKTGQKEDLGLIEPWTKRGSHGPPSYHCFVDERGDCWLTVRMQRTLFVARGATGKIEKHENALPEYEGRVVDPWIGLRALDGDRAMILMDSKLWVFNSVDFNSGKKAFTVFRKVSEKPEPYIAIGGQRVFWTVRQGGGINLHSTSLSDAKEYIDHGQIVDAEGRTPQWPGDLVADDNGHVYMVGRWNVRDEDMETFGVRRHGRNIAVIFSDINVSGDLAPRKAPRRRHDAFSLHDNHGAPTPLRLESDR